MSNPIYKLGKLAARFDHRTLRLAKYLSPDLAPPPTAVDWTNGITSWGWLKNDMLGDCTIAAVAHAIQVWTANAGAEYAATDQVTVEYYSKWDGYNPADPNTDQGGEELTVLNDWRQQGFDSHSLTAFADPQPQNDLHIKQAIALFGGVYIGMQLPNSAQGQVGSLWDVVPEEGGVWGGHAVYVPAYDDTGLTCITWGALQKMTWAFWSRYTDEAHCLLSPDWPIPAGFDASGLLADLQVVAG